MDYPAPLIATKILRPRRRDDLLHRRRLVDFIHSHIDRKLIIISAPAGYGKTSLLIDYAHDTELPVCWYTLDERDSDARMFLEYLVESIRRRFPDFGRRISAILHSDESGLLDWAAAAGVLVNDMVEGIGEYFVIVLDDYHLIDDESDVHDLLDTLLQYLPEHCHILLASRTLPRLTLSRLAAHQEVEGIGVDELRFTAPEIQQLMQQNYDLDLPHEQAEELARELDGWIAGLLLTRHTLWKGLFAGMIRAHGETQVFEYLATEVFEQQPEDVRVFLLDSAVLDQMNPAICSELLDTERARETLRQLESQNLFVFRLEGPGEWYRYHQLFREFLISHLQSTDRQRYRALHLRAANLFAARSGLAPAIQHFLEAEAYDKAAEVIESVADETFNTGHWTTLARWIDALPPEILSKQPRLLTHRAKVWIQVGQLTDAIQYLDRASEIFSAAGEAEHHAEPLTIKSVALRLQGHYEEAIKLCGQALELLGCVDSPEIGAQVSDSPTAAQAYRNIGIVYGILGNLSESTAQLNQALQLYQARGEAYHIASVQHDLATTYLRAGDLAKASMSYRRALRHWRETANYARISETLNGMGCALYYQGAYESARELLEEALVYAQQAQYARAEAAVLAGLGDIMRAVGRYDEALSYYEQALTVAEEVREESIVVYILNTMGLTHCTLGHHNRAWACMSEALSLGQRGGSAYDIGLSRDALGTLSHTRSELDAAVEHFTEAQSQFKACGAKRELAIADLHLAQALFDNTCITDAVHYLRQALDLADELGYDFFLLAEGGRSVELYKRAVARQVCNGRLVRILEHMGEEIPEAQPQIDPEIISVDAEVPLRIQAFGQAQVWMYGKPITRKQWDSATTKELFFFLLSHPGGVRKDKILEVFWPETTPAKASSAFHSTNYRLRRALGRPDFILFQNGVYMFNPELNYWYDVEVFQELLEEARLTESAEERASIYEKAVQLCKGHYLDEFYSDWPFFQREELQRQLFEILVYLAEYYRQEGRAEDSLPLYERIITEDPYQEEIHREIIRVYLELGQRATAVRHYQRLKHFLQEDLGIDPMPETTELYETILSSEELTE